MRLNINLRRPRHSAVRVWGIILLLGWTGGSAFAMGQGPANDPEGGRNASSSEEMPSTPVRAPLALPDAPDPVSEAAGEESSSLQPVFSLNPGDPESWGRVTPNSSERVPLDQCPYDTTRARECRVHWVPLLISASAYNAFQDIGNLYTGYFYRIETTQGHWFSHWINSAAGWRWDRWDDDNPRMDQYVGHPMMGSITNYLWIQNDPKGATVDIGNNWQYWRSRLRATAFSTVFSFQWKLGPFGEASIGHNGDHYYYDKGQKTNETGWVELVTTPVGGLLWTMAEDELDKHVVKRVEARPRRPVTLLLLSFLTPSRATANIFRWRPPWYRDGRVVKASTFWSEPPGPEEAAAESGEDGSGAAANPSSGVQVVRRSEVPPPWPHYGGVHEFGAWWGASLISGHIWGYADDVKYMPIDVNYSYLLHPGTRWNFRYAPELTALAMLDEPVPNPKRRAWEQRKRTYGSGVNPVGFRASFAPNSRVQPFLSTDEGFIYFTDRVLSPQGSQFMYTIDFGGGVQIFRKQRQSISVGYRYQHLSNANISHHNPGTDTNVFYVAVSRFRTKGYR
jgi:hypothetical protein